MLLNLLNTMYTHGFIIRMYQDIYYGMQFYVFGVFFLIFEMSE